MKKLNIFVMDAIVLLEFFIYIYIYVGLYLHDSILLLYKKS